MSSAQSQQNLQHEGPLIPPRSILMIKSHSMGVGDLLRSSAAWRALKNKWPQVQLHLLFLSKHAGYPTEELITEHPLLSSVQFLTIQNGHPGLPKLERPKVPFLKLVGEVIKTAKRCSPDWIIDFEPSGARTSLLTWFATKSVGAKSLGINQVFGRSIFYTESAANVQEFAQARGLNLPLEYTYRDFVVLAAWGIERGSIQIELSETKKGGELRSVLEHELTEFSELSESSDTGGKRIVETLSSNQNKTLAPESAQHNPVNHHLVIGLNIGCGTPDAMYKRPDLKTLANCVSKVNQYCNPVWVLTGAPNEKEVNQEFINIYKSLFGEGLKVVDFAGRCTLSGLTGVINCCDIFISTDSGPYHMAVGLRRPTLVWFTYAEHSSFHDVSWCERLIQPNTQEFLNAFKKLLDLPGSAR